jgi:hypothetical protein
LPRSHRATLRGLSSAHYAPGFRVCQAVSKVNAAFFTPSSQCAKHLFSAAKATIPGPRKGGMGCQRSGPRTSASGPRELVEFAGIRPKLQYFGRTEPAGVECRAPASEPRDAGWRHFDQAQAFGRKILRAACATELCRAFLLLGIVRRLATSRESQFVAVFQAKARLKSAMSSQRCAHEIFSRHAIDH